MREVRTLLLSARTKAGPDGEFVRHISNIHRRPELVPAARHATGLEMPGCHRHKWCAQSSTGSARMLSAASAISGHLRRDFSRSGMPSRWASTSSTGSASARSSAALGQAIHLSRRVDFPRSSRGAESGSAVGSGLTWLAIQEQVLHHAPLGIQHGGVHRQGPRFRQPRNVIGQQALQPR